jgi:hypothetical protein
MAPPGKPMDDNAPPMGPTLSALPGKILDLRPLLQRKKEVTCEHRYATVSMTAAELCCDECSADLDPWTFIRGLCEHEEHMISWRQEQERAVDAKIEEGNKVLARMNETITRLNAEISHLSDVRNKLWNERVPDGRQLAVAARRHRPRKK